jgi:hypothetical protein
MVFGETYDRTYELIISCVCRHADRSNSRCPGRFVQHPQNLGNSSHEACAYACGLKASKSFATVATNFVRPRANCERRSRLRKLFSPHGKSPLGQSENFAVAVLLCRRAVRPRPGITPARNQLAQQLLSLVPTNLGFLSWWSYSGRVNRDIVSAFQRKLRTGD